MITHQLFGFLAAAPLLLSSGDVSVFLGAPGGVGSVQIYDEATNALRGAPAELQGIRLLSLDFCARTALEEHMPDVPRLRVDVEGAARILLPNAQGSLYRYRRDSAQVSTFGYFVVDVLGCARSVLERPGTGVSGTTDPFLARVALNRDGDAMLVATTVAAGGDVLEVDLLTGALEDRSAALAPLGLIDGGLCLLPQWGSAATQSGILRFDRLAGAQADWVPFPYPAPSWFGGELACSLDGGTLATIAGTAATSADAFVFGSRGAAVNVSNAPAHLSSAGYLPNGGDGPLLALAPDGSLLAWRVEGSTRELYVRETGLAAPSCHVTADDTFNETLDTIGEFVFITTSRLVFLAGRAEEEAASGITIGDFYRVDHDAASGVFSAANVSQTSGDTVPPFDAYGYLSNTVGTYRVPVIQGCVTTVSTDGDEDTSDVVVIDWLASGYSGSYPGVASLDLIEVVGLDLALGVAIEEDPEGIDLVRLPIYSGNSTASLGTLPEDFAFLASTAGNTGELALIVEYEGVEWLGRALVADGTLTVANTVPLAFGPLLSFTPAGAIAFSVDLPNGAAFFLLWGSDGSFKLLPPRGSSGFVLPR